MAEIQKATQELQAGHEDEGIGILRSVLKRMEDLVGPENPGLYSGLDAGAKYYEWKGNIPEALSFRSRAQAILEKTKGPNNPEITAGLIDLARLSRVARDYARSESLYRRVLALTGIDPQTRVAALSGLGDLYQAKGDASAALDVLQQLLKYSTSTFGEQHTNTGMALHQLAQLFSARDPKTALPYAERSVSILEKSLGANGGAVGDALRTLAGIKASSGEFVQAEALYRRVLSIYERIVGTQSPIYAHELDMLGGVLALEGNLKDAEKLHLEALGINEKAPGADSIYVAESCRTLGFLYSDMGDLARADTYFRRAIAIYEKLDNPQMLGIVVMGLAMAIGGNGDHEEATRLIEKAIPLLEKGLGDKNPMLASAYIGLGQAAALSGDSAKVGPAFAKALDLARNTTDMPNVVTIGVFDWLATSEMLGGHFEKAAELFNHARMTAGRWPDAPLSMKTGPAVGLAMTAVATGDYASGEVLLNQTIDLMERTYGSDHPDLAEPLLWLSYSAAAKGNSERAFALTSRLLDIEEQNLPRVLAVGSEAQKAAFMSWLRPSTDAAISLNTQILRGDPQAVQIAFNTILRRKGRILEEMTARTRQLRNVLKPEDRKLFDELNAARSEFATLVLQGAGNMKPADFEASVRTRQGDLRGLEASVMAKIPAFASMVKPATFQRVQALIPSNSALVEIVEYSPTYPLVKHKAQVYAAYVLRPTGSPTEVDLGDAPEIDRQVSELRAALRDPKRTDAKEVAQVLDTKIMKPLKGAIGDCTHLFISPDGALNLLPFEALVDEAGRFLIEAYSFTYLTSGRDLITATREPSRQGPVIIANPKFDLGFPATPNSISSTGVDFRKLNYRPLPGTIDEANGIKEILPGASVITGADATEHALKGVTGPVILHIATHGFFLDVSAHSESALDTRLLALVPIEKPRIGVESRLVHSGLILAGVKQGVSGAGDDGVLTGLEVAGLDLAGTKLVVLSACDTGVGHIASAEGVYGLRRALVIAGAESQIISLWPVSDTATRGLMIDLYKRLKAGEGRSEALRQARLDLLHNDKTAHPFYWAAFIQSGDWGNLEWSDEKR